MKRKRLLGDSPLSPYEIFGCDPDFPPISPEDYEKIRSMIKPTPNIKGSIHVFGTGGNMNGDKFEDLFTKATPKKEDEK